MTHTSNRSSLSTQELHDGKLWLKNCQNRAFQLLLTWQIQSMRIFRLNLWCPKLFQGLAMFCWSCHWKFFLFWKEELKPYLGNKSEPFSPNQAKRKSEHNSENPNPAKIAKSELTQGIALSDNRWQNFQELGWWKNLGGGNALSACLKTSGDLLHAILFCNVTALIKTLSSDAHARRRHFFMRVKRDMLNTCTCLACWILAKGSFNCYKGHPWNTALEKSATAWKNLRRS